MLTDHQRAKLRDLADHPGISGLPPNELDAIDAALAEIDRLRAAGDTLAHEAETMIGHMDQKARFGLSVALSAWSAARGDGPRPATHEGHSPEGPPPCPP